MGGKVMQKEKQTQITLFTDKSFLNSGNHSSLHEIWSWQLILQNHPFILITDFIRIIIKNMMQPKVNIFQRESWTCVQFSE